MQPYLPLDHFKATDDDYSTSRIRDMPYGKVREALTLVPSSMNFNSMVLNRISPPETLKLSNVGYDEVPIQTIYTVGDFILDSSGIKSVDIGETISLYVSFYPKIQGLVTGGVYINAPSALGSKFATLTGSGVTSEDLLMQYPLLTNSKVTGASINIANGVYSCAMSGVFDGATAQLQWRVNATGSWVDIPNVKFDKVDTIYGIPLNIGQARILITNSGFATSLTAMLMW
jgi:hypothetical protein